VTAKQSLLKAVVFTSPTTFSDEPARFGRCCYFHKDFLCFNTTRFYRIPFSPFPSPIIPSHLDEPLRLRDAVKFGFPHGGMTVSGFRREARAGRLAMEKIANKNFTTLRAIEEMRKSCRVKAVDRDSGGEKSGVKVSSLSPKERGLLSTVASMTPRDALLAKISRRKNSSRHISRRNVAQIGGSGIWNL
jgi:hypothetical protein